MTAKLIERARFSYDSDSGLTVVDYYIV